MPCSDIKQTKHFYENIIGANIGRKSNNWIDVNLYGHQVTFTKAGKFNFNNPNYIFEGKILPSFHFGIIIEKEEWNKLYDRLSDLELEIVNKKTFLNGKKGEHKSFFIKDPNEYMLEFKMFVNKEEVFEK